MERGEPAEVVRRRSASAAPEPGGPLEDAASTGTKPTAVFFVDREQRCSWVSHTSNIFADLIGENSATASAKARSIRELVGENNFAVMGPALRRALGGNVSHFQLCLAQADRGPRILEGTCVPQPVPGSGSDGPVDGALIVLVDVSERVRSHLASQQAWGDTRLLYEVATGLQAATTVEAMFDLVHDALASGLGGVRTAVHLLDGGGVLRFRSSRGLSDAFCTAAEAVVLPWASIAPPAAAVQVAGVDEHDDPAVHAATGVPLGPALRAEGLASLLLVPIGGPRDHLSQSVGMLVGMLAIYSGTPRLFAEREQNLATGMARHLAASICQKRTEFERAAQIDALARTIALNEQFTGILGHDLRNPLQSMLTAAEILIRRAPDPKVANTAARIVASGNRMNRMIEQLLDFNRIRAAGTVSVEPAPTDVAAIWRVAVEEFAAKGAIRIQYESRGNTVGPWDSVRLAQVASNLLANAIHHGTPDAPVAIDVDGTELAAVRIHIHNGGCIPEPLLPSLFEPFRSGDWPRSRGDGLGLGLFITRRIVEAHRGTIEVVSSPSGGTKFSICLPRPQPPDAA